MDWDDIAWRVTGPEGGDRYVRMGIVLVVLAIISMAAVGFTPIYRSDDASLTYDMMAEDPDDDTAFGVPNSHVLGHANWALAGAFLTIMMGLVLILEGKRVVNLRRVMVWHAEARATALFSLAAFLSSLGLFAGASLLGLAESMPMGSAETVDVTYQVFSPAAIVVVVTMGLATAGMLGMAYYNCVLSVYRGGGDPVNRRMARFAMLLAVLSLGGVLLLRLGVIMTATLPVAELNGDTLEMHWPYTMSRIDHQSTLGMGEEMKGRLDLQLTVASGLLLFAAMSAMAGLVGVSARSLGGTSLRVRRATALPTEGLAAAGIALLLLAWASSTAPTAVRDSLSMSDLEVTLGWGLYSGVLLALVAIAGALGYVGGLGIREAREALAIWRRKELSKEVEEEGIPQPMVDQVLEEEARARGEFPPMEPEVTTPPLRERLLLKDARRNQVIIGVLVVVAIILIAVFWPGGPGGWNGNGGPEEVLIMDLPEFTWNVAFDEYLLEGEDLFIDAFVDIKDNPTNAIFINSVSVHVTWTDEPDEGILWTNQPDSFTARVDDDHDIDTADRSGTNPQGGQGSVIATWSSGDAWVVTGNPELVDWGDQDVFEGVTVMAGTSMDSAGDQVTLLGRTQVDPGNGYSISITLSGRHYTQP